MYSNLLNKNCLACKFKSRALDPYSFCYGIASSISISCTAFVPIEVQLEFAF